MSARGVPLSTVVTHDCKFLRYTTCGITKAGIGGPLLKFDGTFVGMNLYDKYGVGTPYLQGDVILQVLKHFKTQRTVAEAGHDSYASRMLGWTIPGDEHRSLNRYDFAMRMRREQFFHPVLVWFDEHSEAGADPAPPPPPSPMDATELPQSPSNNFQPRMKKRNKKRRKK